MEEERERNAGERKHHQKGRIRTYERIPTPNGGRGNCGQRKNG